LTQRARDEWDDEFNIEFHVEDMNLEEMLDVLIADMNQ